MKRNPKVQTALICIGEGAEATWYVGYYTTILMLTFSALKDHKESTGSCIPRERHCGYTECVEEYLVKPN